MSSEPDFDHILQHDFRAVQRDDARQAPDFGLLIARARDAAAASATTPPPVTVAAPRWIAVRKRLLLVGAPLAAAAALASWFRPTSAADREFEEAVAAWSKTAAQTATSPTDGLLSVPGTEFLRGTPMDGTVARPPRRGT
jgi:hypothetical protein